MGWEEPGVTPGTVLIYVPLSTLRDLLLLCTNMGRRAYTVGHNKISFVSQRGGLNVKVLAAIEYNKII